MKLDHVDDLDLPDADVAARGNELSSLMYLQQGLQFLNDQVASLEAEVCRRVDCDRRVVTLFGNAPAFAGLPMGFVAMSFHWYAVTACNYVRLVGWLGRSQDSSAARAYMETVIPKVKLWRDKVAAHFAITDPKGSDTPAGLAASVMFPVGFVDRSFVAQPLTLALAGPSGRSVSPGMSWSLTDTHAELAKRYWPTPHSANRPPE